MADVEFRLIDNTPATLQAFDRATKAALEACGQQGATYAKQTVIANRASHTGRLKDINSLVQGKSAYVGTNTTYAKYHEYGTGIYIGGGRKSPWAYQDAEGEWHWTRGVPPLHMIKDAVANHVEEYKGIFKKYLSRL